MLDNRSIFDSYIQLGADLTRIFTLLLR